MGGSPCELGAPRASGARHCALAVPARIASESPAMKAAVRFIGAF
jgi:hypothetical protein